MPPPVRLAHGAVMKKTRQSAARLGALRLSADCFPYASLLPKVGERVSVKPLIPLEPTIGIEPMTC
jgi:hypothetical protein